MAGNSAVAGQSVVSKLNAILLAFSEGGTHTVTEIAQLTGLTMSTTHRLATELAAHRVLERTTDGRLRAGAPLRTLRGVTSMCNDALRDRAAAVLDDIADITGHEVRFGTLNDLRVACLRKLPGQTVSDLALAPTLPIHATALGKILLAFTPKERLETVISQGLDVYTTHTVTDPGQFRYVIKLTRQRRYAVADNDHHLNYSAVAVPVFGPGGNLIAALEMRVDNVATGVPSALPALKMAANSFSRELGQSVCSCPPLEANSTQFARPSHPSLAKNTNCNGMARIITRSWRAQ